MLKTMLILAITTQVICLDDSFTDKCFKHTETGKILTCIGSLSTQGRISTQEMLDALFKLIEQNPSDNTYYSIGMMIGKDPALLVGYQNHPIFTNSYRIPLRIPYLSEDHPRVEVPNNKDIKKVMIYTQVKAAEFPKVIMQEDTKVIGGTSQRYTIYYAPGWENKIQVAQGECQKLEKIGGYEKIKNSENIVYIVPRADYCQEVKAVEIYQAEKRTGEKTLRIKVVQDTVPTKEQVNTHEHQDF